MKTTESIAKATVKAFEAVGLPLLLNLFKARHIFAPGCLKWFERSKAMLYTILNTNYQKSDTRRMDGIYEYTTYKKEPTDV